MYEFKFFFLQSVAFVNFPLKYIMKKLVGFLLFLSLSTYATNSNVTNIEDPLDVIELIGNKLINETPFRYRLELASNDKSFDKMQSVNFGRTFGMLKPGVAYAYTLLNSPEDKDMDIDLEHNDGCKIWLNGKPAYEKNGDREIRLSYDERSLEMSFHATLHLKKGVNTLLIKSETAGNKTWCFYMQPPATKGAVLTNQEKFPKFCPEKIRDADARIFNLTNWLVIGPFERNMDQVQAPEQKIQFGIMYQGAGQQQVTWTIPKVEILGDVINPKPWGTTYQWNYHNGGVAWAMEKLTEVSGNPKYKQWADNFCDFNLKGKPFVEYQVKTLNQTESANHFIVDAPLLDFTLAPSLPIIYRLRKEKDFPLESMYKSFIDSMIYYARNVQLRYPGTNMYTRTTPQKYTTWVDDMFMGIPFLVQASEYVKSKEDKEYFINDAALMVLNFNKFVWDNDANLYMHANFSTEKNEKFPHWSRANGWGIWATTEVLMHLDPKNQYYKPILEHYRRHVESLIKFQTADGAWRNVLDRKESQEEISGTAIFTMAIARGITYGWLDGRHFQPVVMKGWDYVKSNIEPSGKVHNICVGTMCSRDVNYYVNRPFYDDDTHGLFAVLFAGIEVHNMMNRTLTSQQMEK